MLALALILMLAAPIGAAETPMVWEIIDRTVEREDGQVSAVIFRVRVAHTTFQVHEWFLMDPQPAQDPGIPTVIMRDGRYYEDRVVAMTQEFDIPVPVVYASNDLTADQKKTLKVLLRQETRARRDEWQESMRPKPERRSRQQLGRAAVQAMLGAVEP